jgi:hypothetical protein
MARGRRFRRTPVNSIRFVAALVMMLIFLSMLGVREQEVSQLLAGVKVMSLLGLIASLVSLVIMVYPKICAVVVVSNILGLAV